MVDKMAAKSILICLSMVLAIVTLSEAEPVYGGYNSYAGADGGGYAAGSAGAYRYNKGYGGAYYPPF
ncbi:hypothetical protein Anas_08255 [Armadillidium nasatum]|uniref:Uncharacterized protein n=1 Tax=Armadillidium nasatum TaxID=96803 RepID=A0A5N5SP70_9CRUS|nr:hypothetical protein Anas_08255 [Armadillidium nasatum]